MARRKPPREVEVDVETLGGDGYGGARVGERALRVKNGLPGERVVAKVLKRRRGEWLSEAVTVLGPAAAQRIVPACPAFPRCGGCALQHLDYHAQLELKEAELLRALEENGVVPEKVLPATCGPRFGYRTKARFGVRVVGGEVLVGFRESFSNRVGRMDRCPVLVPSLSGLLPPLKALIAGLSRPDRVPQVEVAAGDDARAVILRHLDPLTDPDRRSIRGFSETHRVRCYTQAGGYETLLPASAPSRTRLLGYANPDYGLHLLFEPVDFTQVNLQMNRKLVRAAVSALAVPPGQQVLDLFCGIGNFSLALAAAGARVKGLEASASAIERARMNSLRNGLGRWCEFAVQDLYDADSQLTGQASYLLLDPPRSGAGPNLAAWAGAGNLRRVAYVSCSPASFAADAAVLQEAGFVLEQVGIFDMFPNTAHVETLGVFQKQPW